MAPAPRAFARQNSAAGRPRLRIWGVVPAGLSGNRDTPAIHRRDRLAAGRTQQARRAGGDPSGPAGTPRRSKS
ncbi:hypothetical protein KL86PLE_40577 [uncultured Pleomorphomonas sp.]|uniref:Uncharacterized protein n=1 Tax=uncultured Pleomorphomonas sp. TaxID=442121 RepID=A0A212LGU2_9HYPH|nr:hypothetical protein KL86PLE_40577 [uncultured Pleomorphomonas sp.]